MKKIKSVLVLLLFVFSTGIYAQINFVGIYRIQSKGCGDYKCESSEVSNDAEYDTISKAFKKEHGKQNPNTYYIDNSTFAIVLEYTTHLFPGACEYTEIIMQRGSSLGKIRANYKDIYIRYKGVYVTEPKEIKVFEPKPAQATNITIKSYPNINARFIPQTENGKKAVAAQFTNKHTTKSVAVKVIIRDINNKITKEEIMILKNGETITKKLGEAASYEINISPPFEKTENQNSTDFIENIKNWTKETIQSKEFDKPTSGVGRRG